MYCVYLTTYSGNKLPPFYIGYVTMSRLNSGYRGSVSSKNYKAIWKSELKSNPHLFKTTIITIHKTKEEAVAKETYFQKFFQVHTNPMYINRHINGDKFYYSPLGIRLSNETKKRISDSLKGENCYMFGVPKDEVIREKISNTRKELQVASGENNPMFGRNHSSESIQKMSDTRKKNNIGQTEKFIEANPNKISLTDGTTIFRSLREASRYFGVDRSVIKRLIRENQLQYC